MVDATLLKAFSSLPCITWSRSQQSPDSVLSVLPGERSAPDGARLARRMSSTHTRDAEAPSEGRHGQEYDREQRPGASSCCREQHAPCSHRQCPAFNVRTPRARFRTGEWVLGPLARGRKCSLGTCVYPWCHGNLTDRHHCGLQPLELLQRAETPRQCIPKDHMALGRAGDGRNASIRRPPCGAQCKFGGQPWVVGVAGNPTLSPPPRGNL